MKSAIYGNKLIGVLTALLLAGTLLQGCGGKQSEPVIEVQDTGASFENDKQPAAEPAKTGEQKISEEKPLPEKPEETPAPEPTLAEKLVGRYSAPTGIDGAEDGELEYCVLEIYKVGENLYGSCGKSFGTEKDKGEPYTYWALEFIPEDPSQLMSITASTCIVGVLSFSDQSNLSQYWSAPKRCRIRLLEDGIDFEGIDGEDQPILEGPQNVSFERDDSVKPGFVYETEELSQYSKKNTPAGLYGTWEQENTADPAYLNFRDGDLIRIWHKKAGCPVDLYGGKFFIGDEGTLVMTTSKLGCGDMPYERDGDRIRLEGDRLIMTMDDTEPLFDTGDIPGNIVTFVRTDPDRMPVSMLVRPDDPDVYNLSLKAYSPSGDILRVIPQFRSLDDVENNGGRFVRVGEMIFFRICEPKGERIVTNWGDCMNDPALQKGSRLCYYDRRTGMTGIACEDGAYGPIWYMDGRFYSTVYDESGEKDQSQVIVRYWPNGDGMEDYSFENYSRILAVSDGNRHIAVSTWGEESCYCTDGTVYINTYSLLETENVIDAFFEGEDMYVFAWESYGDQYGLTQIRPDDGNETGLGALLDSEWDGIGYPSIVQHMVRDGELYLGVVWYEGTGMFISDYRVLKAKPGQEMSLETVASGLPDSMEEGDSWVPKFYFDETGKLQYLRHDPEGEAVLSEGTYGDLVYWRNSVDSKIVRKDFIKSYPYNVPDGKSTELLEDTEYVDGAVWVITAQCIRREDEDIGWRESYELESLTWQRIGIDGTAHVIGKFRDSSKKAGATPGSASDTAAKKAFEHILDLYRDAVEKDLDEDSIKASGLESVLPSYGWPAGYGKEGLGYIYRDINGDGLDELIVTLGNDIADIFGFNGKEAFHAYGCPYRGMATLYADGTLVESWGSMKSASLKVFKYNGTVGCMLPIALETYDPSEENSSHYFMYGGESSWSNVESEFKETGSIPDWALEWDYETDEEEFNSTASSSDEVAIEDPTPLFG